MATYTPKLKWAWQAQYLSLTLLILKLNTTFEDAQMMLKRFLVSLLVSDFLRSVWNVTSTSVAILFLSSKLDVVQKNDDNKQLQEVEQETLETTAEEDEIICDDKWKPFY